MFASDCSFDPEGGPGFIRDGLRAVDALDLDPDPAVRTRILSGNARALLGMP